MHDLDLALDALDLDERAAIAFTSAKVRDRHLSEGHPRMAAFFHALADAAASSSCRERALFRALEADLDAGAVTFGED